MSLTLQQGAPDGRRAWTIEELASLTPQELALAISIKQYQGIAIPTVGSGSVPPVAAAMPVQSGRIAPVKPGIRKAGELQLPEALARMRKVCPKCGETKTAGRDFGPRLTGSGKIVPQSWCRDCRGKPNKQAK